MSTTTTTTTTAAPPPTAAIDKNCRAILRVKGKLDASFNTSNYYEAHQMYKTLNFRLGSQKKYDECLELLYDGAIRFLNAKEYAIGTDLGIMIVDTLQKYENISNYKHWINNLSNVLSKIDRPIVERETLLHKVLKWSAAVSSISIGHPIIHTTIAQKLWSEGDYENARKHFLMSRNGEECGQMLIALSDRGFSSEFDLFLAQIILQLLCAKDIECALITFNVYTKNHPKLGSNEPPFLYPLINFIYYLMKVIELGKLDMFQTLCSLYKPSLERDPSYTTYITKIGELFFNVPVPQQPAGYFDGIMNLFRTPRTAPATPAPVLRTSTTPPTMTTNNNQSSASTASTTNTIDNKNKATTTTTSSSSSPPRMPPPTAPPQSNQSSEDSFTWSSRSSSLENIIGNDILIETLSALDPTQLNTNLKETKKIKSSPSENEEITTAETTAPNNHNSSSAASSSSSSPSSSASSTINDSTLTLDDSSSTNHNNVNE